MKLIPNAGKVARKSHSMWAFYLSFAALVTPEVIFYIWQIDTNPRLWWFSGVALLAYGIVGRLKDQGINDD